MFLKHRRSQNLVEVLTPSSLWNPFCHEVTGRLHAGEEMQEPETFEKAELVFLSGEQLPSCWLDPHYRDHANDILYAVQMS